MRCLQTWCTQLLIQLLPAGKQTLVYLMGKGLYVKHLKWYSAELFKMELCNPRAPGQDIMALHYNTGSWLEWHLHRSIQSWIKK